MEARLLSDSCSPAIPNAAQDPPSGGSAFSARTVIFQKKRGLVQRDQNPARKRNPGARDSHFDSEVSSSIEASG